MTHADRVRRPGCHNLIDIGPELQALVVAAARPVQLDRDPWRIFDFDAPSLSRRFKPVCAIGRPAQHAAEQANQFFAPNRAAAVQPCAIALDQKWQVAALHPRPARYAGARHSVRRYGLGTVRV